MIILIMIKIIIIMIIMITIMRKLFSFLKEADKTPNTGD